MSFEIKKGQLVALVGPSGSGKTSITHLLNHFYEPDRGLITIDGIPLHNIKKKSLYEKISLVSQESILFNDTVYANLILGNPKADRKQIEAAAHAANATDFIHQLPEGYETIIGEGGNKLSGGQKQRLTIARALVKNPELLILDEATAALDTQSEQQIHQALEELMKNRTSLVIAHRLSTVQHADLILVVKEGQISDSGTHQLLIKNNKDYKSWVHMQQMD